MLRRSVMTLSPSDGSVDSWADDAGKLNARVIPGAGAGFTLETGERLSAESATAIMLTTGSLYSGWDLEIYAPGATKVTVDGVVLPEGEDGCTACVIPGTPWMRVVTEGTQIQLEGGQR
jgi:hypothetical protein